MNDIERLISMQVLIAVAEAYEILLTDKQELIDFVEQKTATYWSENVVKVVLNLELNSDNITVLTTATPGMAMSDITIPICVAEAEYSQLINAIKEVLSDKEKQSA